MKQTSTTSLGKPKSRPQNPKKKGITKPAKSKKKLSSKTLKTAPVLPELTPEHPKTQSSRSIPNKAPQMDIHFSFDTYTFERKIREFKAMKVAVADKYLLNLLQTQIESNQYLVLMNKGLFFSFIGFSILAALLYWTMLGPILCFVGLGIVYFTRPRWQTLLFRRFLLLDLPAFQEAYKPLEKDEEDAVDYQEALETEDGLNSGSEVKKRFISMDYKIEGNTEGWGRFGLVIHFVRLKNKQVKFNRFREKKRKTLNFLADQKNLRMLKIASQRLESEEQRLRNEISEPSPAQNGVKMNKKIGNFLVAKNEDLKMELKVRKGERGGESVGKAKDDKKLAEKSKKQGNGKFSLIESFGGFEENQSERGDNQAEKGEKRQVNQEEAQNQAQNKENLRKLPIRSVNILPVLAKEKGKKDVEDGKRKRRRHTHYHLPSTGTQKTLEKDGKKSKKRSRRKSQIPKRRRSRMPSAQPRAQGLGQKNSKTAEKSKKQKEKKKNKQSSEKATKEVRGREKSPKTLKKASNFTKKVDEAKKKIIEKEAKKRQIPTITTLDQTPTVNDPPPDFEMLKKHLGAHKKEKSDPRPETGNQTTKSTKKNTSDDNPSPNTPSKRPSLSNNQFSA